MNPIDYSPLFDCLKDTDLSGWIPDLERLIKANIDDSNNGHLDSWIKSLEALPPFVCECCELSGEVRFDGLHEAETFTGILQQLHPWRKGPLNLGGVIIDTEWRSDWKWDRLKNHITNLQDRMVLDIGCGNGYHLWRMLGEGARLAIGIDPFLLFVMQFWATKHFATPNLHAWVLPLGWEDLPEALPYFDTVFSMGVLYHRRNPGRFLEQLQNYVRPGGELVLETLVIEGDSGEVIIPEGRYAKMRNVWYIPSVSTLETALKDSGWENVCCIDVTPTTIEEQRSTEWMTFESLKDYLHPNDSSLTLEGHPAPQRAILLANRPD